MEEFTILIIYIRMDIVIKIQYISRDAVNWRQNIDSVNSKTDE